MAKITANLDKKRELKLTMLAWEYLSEKYGSAPAAIEKFRGVMSHEVTGEVISAIIDFVYAACLHEDETVTRRAIANAISFENLGDISQALAEAVTASLPKQKEGEVASAADPQ